MSYLNFYLTRARGLTLGCHWTVATGHSCVMELELMIPLEPHRAGAHSCLVDGHLETVRLHLQVPVKYSSCLNDPLAVGVAGNKSLSLTLDTDCQQDTVGRRDRVPSLCVRRRAGRDHGSLSGLFSLRLNITPLSRLSTMAHLHLSRSVAVLP